MTPIQSNDPVPYLPSTVLPENYEQEEEILRQAYNILLARMGRMSGPITSPATIGRLLCTKIGGNAVESLGAVYLDNQHRVIALEELFTGTVDACNVSVPHLLRSCVLHRACALILYHNHPSGNTTPSKVDIQTTERVREALKLLTITILDHIIVAGNEHTSLRESNPHLFSQELL